MAHILAVLWLILKIILWILLGILCIVLLFLICPFTYKGSFYKQEDSIKASGAFHDFLFLFGMKANYQESLSVKVRILFFTVYDSAKPKEKSWKLFTTKYLRSSRLFQFRLKQAAFLRFMGENPNFKKIFNFFSGKWFTFGCFFPYRWRG